MLKVFRDNLKHLIWVLWVVIAVFVLFIFTDFGGFNTSGLGTQGNAATAGDQSVSLDEFRQVYQRVEAQYRQAMGEQFTAETAKQMRLPVQVLDQLINQKILMTEAERMGLRVSDKEMQDFILAEPAFKDEKGQFIGHEAYERFLQRQGGYRNAAEFEKSLREQLLLQKLNQALMAGIYVSDQEVERAYREQVERAKVRYVQLPVTQLGDIAGQIPQNELQAYFDAHQAEFRLPEQREAAYLLVDFEKLREQTPVSDAELRSYYDSHKSEFTQEEQVRARHILVFVNAERNEQQARARIEEAQRRLAGGADFAAVAKEYSDDTASAGSGGDLGYFGRQAMVPEFANAAFTAPVNKVVGPVRTQYGFHLIEVTDKRPGGERPFEEAKAQIQARLSGERVQKLAETRAKDIASRLAKDKPESAEALQSIANSTPGVTFATTGKFGQNDAVKDLGYAPTFTNAAFQLEKGGVSEAVQVPRGWAVIYLQNIHEPAPPKLADVEPRVRAAAARAREQKIAIDRLNTARAGGKSLDQVAADLGLTVKETPEFGLNGSIPGLGFNPELARKAMALKVGDVGGPVSDPQGALLFQVTERKGVTPTELAAAKQQTLLTVKQDKLGRLRAALLEQRRREMGVEYDRQLLESFGLIGDQATPAG